MAGAARIGALHVMLGLDSAEFTAGLNKANSGLDKFAKGAKIGLAAVSVAAAAAGTALAIAVKGAIDNADEMSKTAQKVGVTTEALSRLNYAAGLSDVTLEQLSKGLGRLTQSMSQIAQGMAGPAKMAFDALGISAMDASGHLRSSDDVLADVAERFARMEDGATKTALAIALFGRSGADLIPMLNMGKSGLADLATEADRLGITLSTSTGRSAEAFNDSLTRLQSVFAGVINRIMVGILPALDEFSAKISDPAFAQSAEVIGLAIVDSMKMAVDSINTVVGAFTALQNSMSWLNDHDLFGKSIGRGNGAGKEFQAFNTPDQAKQQLADALNAGKTGGPGADFYTGIFGAPAAEIAASAQQVATAFEPVITNTKAAAAGADALKTAMSDGKAVFEATRTPAEAYGLEVERLNGLLAQGAIDHDTYARAIKQAQDAMTAAQQTTVATVDTMGELKSLAGDLGNTLANAFMTGENASEAFFKTAMNGLSNLTSKLLEMAANGLFDIIANAFGGGFGMGGGMRGTSSITGSSGGFFPGFANGTNFAPGGLAMVGERGPELVNLPRGSQVIPNSDLRGGGSTVVRVELSPDLEARILQESAGQSVQIVRAAAPSIASQGAAAAGSSLGNGDFDGGMRRFGVSPQAKRR